MFLYVNKILHTSSRFYRSLRITHGPKLRKPAITKIKVYIETELIPQEYQGVCCSLYFLSCLANCFVVVCVQEYYKHSQLRQLLNLIKSYRQVVSNQFYSLYLASLPSMILLKFIVAHMVTSRQIMVTHHFFLFQMMRTFSMNS